jgi:CO/xanthine dehydrogenase FAD-binding subunit
MLLPKFDFIAPSSMEDACKIMAELGEKARPIAGGTDLLVNMKKKIFSPRYLVSISGIASLKEVESTAGNLRIGAGCTVADLADSTIVAKRLIAICHSAASIGSPLVRNRATIGGNIGSARPAADLPPVLMVCGALVVLTSETGERNLPLDTFFTGPGFTRCHKDEIITAIHVPVPVPGSGAGYLNLGPRKAADCNIINVASFLALDSDGTIKESRIVMGSVGPTPIPAPSAERLLLGEKPGEQLFKRAGAAAARDSTPIDDFRGSAQYKRAMAGVLTERTLHMALQEAGG